MGLVTIGISTYQILWSKQLFERLSPWLSFFQRSALKRPADLPGQNPVDVVVFGLGRFGATLANMVTRAGRTALAVDFDPQAVAKWNAQGIETLFGDASDRHLLASIPLSGTPLVVSTLPSADENIPLLRGLRSEGYEGKIALVARTDADARRYEAEDADLVLEPAIVTGGALFELLDTLERSANR